MYTYCGVTGCTDVCVAHLPFGICPDHAVHGDKAHMFAFLHLPENRIEFAPEMTDTTIHETKYVLSGG